ncbi:hypothetical protein B296_00025840 [Ensete ventricosum]|uniref:Uncharacterized protein n=1 Tax=Ensete ventricosum TaxID=4639 RepID=A0A426ZWM0_ENSVE|nr:hypothetical protein B296_00025840 [Ensete ventricosum]
MFLLPCSHLSRLHLPKQFPQLLLTDELRERSTKGLCWHYDELWSREHRCKKGRLLVIESVEDEDNETSKEAFESEEEAMEEESHPADYAVHTLAGGVSCSKGATAIGGRRGNGVHNCCGGRQQRLQRKIAVGSFLTQGSLLAVIKEDGCERSLLAVIKEDGCERSLLATLGSERCVLRLKR